MENELREAELRLQTAQLAGDLQTLDELLDDRLIFTFGADTFTKADDLELHQSSGREQARGRTTDRAGGRHHRGDVVPRRGRGKRHRPYFAPHSLAESE
ncbi:nuclear transport factor 2 family protein [Rhodococcus sp. NPDC127528]|uniref:nuclear transport factor 2 family protein n=1 Tax=unclassified Rhodococcus (in: high G+C Gram-positive bacteria) TaxID=192944 RepID=UPI00363471D2